METRGIVAALAAAVVVAAACAAWLAWDRAELRRSIAVAEAEAAAARHAAEAARSEAAAALADAAAAPQAAPPAEGQPAGAAAMPQWESSAIDPEPLLEALLGNVSGGGGEGPAAAVKNLLGGGGGDLMRNSAAMSVDMMYGPFLAGYDHAPETRDALRDALVESAVGALDLAGDFFGGGGDDLAARGEAVLADMRERVRAILGDDGHAAFTAYEEEMPRRMMEESLDMQLRLLGGGLDEDHREVVRGVLVDEMLATLPEAGSMAVPGNFDEAMAGQTEAYERALDRLRAALPEDQFAHAERFLRQQIQMHEAMRGMFESMDFQGD